LQQLVDNFANKNKKILGFKKYLFQIFMIVLTIDINFEV